MKQLFAVVVLLTSLNAYSHGGDDGPSTLEQEFAKLSHIHLPINYSTHHGLILGYDSEGHHEDEHEEDGEGIDFNLHPVFFGGFDKIKRLTCLEAQIQKIEACPDSAAYLLVESKKWDIGLGAEADFHLPVPYAGVGGGVAYLKGKNYISQRTLTHKYELRKKLQFPVSSNEFDNWRVGDQLTFMNKGSVIANVFVGIEPFFHMGPEFIHTGIQKISARKTSESTLEVEFSLVKSNSLGVEGNAIVLNAEASGSKGKSKSVIYEFHLTDEKAFEAVAALFSGRLDITNKLMLVSGGNILLRTSLHTTGRSISGSFGLPVVYFNGALRGHYHSNGELEEHEEGQTHHHEIYTSARMKERFTRGTLSQHTWESSTLITTLLRDEHKSDESILSAVFSWSFSKDQVRTAKFDKKMRKLVRITGIEVFKKFQLPANYRGYAKVDVSMSLSGAQILRLLNAQERTVLEGLQKVQNYRAFNKRLLNMIHRRLKKDETTFWRNGAKVQMHLEGESLKKTVIQIR